MRLILKFVSVIFDIDCLLINLAIVCINCGHQILFQNNYLFIKNVYLHLMSLNCHTLEGTMKSNSVALSGRGWKIKAKRSFW